MTGRGRIGLAVAALALAAAFSPCAFAGTGSTYDAPLLEQAPTIDGALGTFEWGQAASYGVAGGTLYVGRTAGDLYLAFHTDAAPTSSAETVFSFESGNDGVLQNGDDQLDIANGVEPDWFNLDGRYLADDESLLASPGTEDVTAASSSTNGYTVEVSHPLCDSDSAHDICWTAGSIGFDVEYGASGAPAAPAVAGWASLAFPGDTTPPNLTFSPPAQGAYSSWPGFTAVADDTSGPPTVALQYSTSSNGPWTTAAVMSRSESTYSATPTVPTADGLYYWRAHARDAAGNTADSASVPLELDTTGPSIDVTCNSKPCTTWFAPADGPIAVQYTIQDSATIAKEAWALSGDPLDSSNTDAHVLPGDRLPDFSTTTTIKFAATDGLGNRSDQTVTVQIDDSAPPPPTVTLLSPSTTPDGHAAASFSGGTVYYNPNVAGSFSLSVPQDDDQESGIASASFSSLGATGWTETASPPRSESYSWTQQPQLPDTSVNVSDVNGAGTASSGSTRVGFQSDASQPTGTLTCVPSTCTNANGPVTVTPEVTDALSGLDRMTYTTDGTTPSATNGTPLTPGGSFEVTKPGSNVQVWAVDNVGNEGLAGTNSNISGVAPTTTSSVPSAPQIGPGDSVYDRATVTPSGGGQVTGTVTFSVCGPLRVAAGCTEGTVFDTETYVASNTTFIDSAPYTPTLSGWYCFRADYNGDANFAPSSDGSAAECFQVLRPGEFVVNTTADHDDGACDAVDCTLREAIAKANAFDGTGAEIDFAIPTPSPVINATSPLPTITSAVTIDGTTEPGWLAGPGVAISGSGLTVTGSDSRILGLKITNPVAGEGGGSGILVQSANRVEIANVEVASSGGNGIYVQRLSDISIHDTLIDGNSVNGIRMTTVTGADVARTTIRDNNWDGIEIEGGSGNVVEDSSVTGSRLQGISVFGGTTGNTLVGDTVADTGQAGILLGGTTNNTVGTPARPDVVHGNDNGVTIDNATGNAIRGNSIYDNAGGTGNGLGIFYKQTDPIPVPSVKPFVRSGTVYVNAQVAGGAPATSYTVDVYANSACSPSGSGEGETWKGSLTVTTDGNGVAAVPISFGAGTTVPFAVTATATDVAVHQTSGFSRCATLATGTATSASLTLTSNTASTEPGAAKVPLGLIPPSAFATPTTSDDGSTQSAPLTSIPLTSIPLTAIPLTSIPLTSIPLTAIGLDQQTLFENGLGGVPLNTIPLKAPLSWETELQGTALAGLPIQTLTLADVFKLSPAPANLTDATLPNAITLKDIDLSHSPLTAIPLTAIVLGELPLTSIPIEGGWCQQITSLPEFASYDCSQLGSQTVMGIALQGVPLTAIPLTSIPLTSIPLTSIPLGALPLSKIDIAGSPLTSIPLTSIDLSQTPLTSIPLTAINLSSIVDCTTFDCAGKTLGDVLAAGAFKPGATLGDLESYLVAHPEITLASIAPGLPDTVTLRDLLAALLGGPPVSWEQLPLDGLQAFAGQAGAEGGLVTYTASFTLQGTGADAAAGLHVALPDDAYYVPGSATLDGDQLVDPATAGGLDWSLGPLTWDEQHTVTFQVRPGFELGDETAKATLSTSGVDDTIAQADVTVGDTFESNNQPSVDTAPPVNPDTLYVSYIANGKDVDYSRLHIDPTNAPAGSRIKLFLSHLHSDDDLAVFGAAQQPLRSSPLTSIPLTSIPTTDQPVQLGQQSQSLSADTAQDIPLPPGKTLLGVSDNRGTADEEIDLTSTGLTDDLLIQVSSYDGHPTTDPYVLRVEIDPPPALPPCTQTAPSGAGTTEATMPTITSSTQTLILFDEQRLGQYYSQADAHDVYTRLQTYAARSDVNGAIVPVEANTGVAAAYAAWDANLCSPAAANAVVRAIGGLLDTLEAGHPNLKSIVVVGEDNVIPFARLLDETQQANELGFRSTFGYVNNEYVGAVANGYLLSDDPYADADPQPLLGGSLYVPKLALGRLVETPQDIEKQLDTYQATNGLANPQTKLVTGYDFLTDGSQAVDSALGRTSNPNNLISETWTADQLRGALLPATGAPLIDSLNAHYDQHRALSAQGNATHDESPPNLFTTTDLRGQNLAGRIVFTMGCHAGFSLFDGLSYFGADPNPTDFTFDWPQAYMAGGAIEFMGNTGYGLGDTAAVAYSERLNQLFAQRLDGTMTIGEALEYAKQEYVGDLGVLSLYDAKVGNEATLYGIPTYRLGTGTPPAAPTPAPTHVDQATGLVASDFSVAPTFTSHTNANLGDYYSANDPNGIGIQVTNRRPIEPLTSLDVTQPGTTAHGVLLTGLASHDVPGFKVAFGRVTADSSAIEPQLTGLVDFPASIQSLATIATPNGQRQRAVLIAGHFASGASGSVGDQRLFDRLAGTVLYSQSTDFTKPTIQNVQVVQAGSGVGFSADVPDTDVKEVVALYLDSSNTWQRIDLACTAAGRCTGGGPLTGTTVDYVVEAVDSAGNVGINANKAAAANVAPSGSGHISISVTGAGLAGGWYGGAVTATLSSDDGASLSSSLDGAAYVDGATVSVSGEGLHTLDVRGSDGSSATFAVPIDTHAPGITIVSPVDGSYLLGGDVLNALYSCTDGAGSGLAQCAGPVPSGSPVDATAGNKTFTVNARDVAGHTATASVGYQVWPWTGFLAPVNNLPTINSVKAGSAVPVKFSLGGDRGNSFATFKSQVVACESGAPLDAIETTLTAGASSLTYDATTGQYTYVWKTDKAYAGQCRLFTIGFTNGDVRKAEFKFK